MSNTGDNAEQLHKGSKTDLAALRYTVRVSTSGPQGIVDVAAVLLGTDGNVRTDDDFVFFNNPRTQGCTLLSEDTIEVDLNTIPASVDRILITASTEAQNTHFGTVSGLAVHIASATDKFEFAPAGLTTETVLQAVALYRRGSSWRLDAIGQGYAQGLAKLATEHGITIDEPSETHHALPQPLGSPAPSSSAPGFQQASAKAQSLLSSAKRAISSARETISASAPADAADAHSQNVSGPPVSFDKVTVALTKDSSNRTARIDLRKSQGDPNWVLTVGLEWDGRGATYDRNGNVTKFGTGDLDVYFFCRNEDTNDYVVISGDRGHQGDLKKWPYLHHYGDSKGPGRGNKPAAEQVRVLPNENGDLLVNIYQSVDNGGGALDKFGKPRVAIRYGRAGKDGLPGPDADEILVFVGNSKNSFWATVAHIDVQDGVLTVDGETRYSRIGSEKMPGLDANSTWVRAPAGGPTGRSKKRNRGLGLDKYKGRCQP
ncbi:TerD family protein [Rhodococcus fascians]|uniref:TerD family protein n=1 Tax=Rhodococcoides fascians TaxID=1828 RepID=UPI0024B7C8DD|nr:TerD family protein [Rhodococcus fascians]MDJ0004793.1 TerD family protein [Rhodococcus fascians]